MHRLPNGRGSERRATSRDREGVGAYSRRRSCRLLLGSSPQPGWIQYVAAPGGPSTASRHHAGRPCAGAHPGHFDRQDLFQNAPHIRRRMVAWCPDSNVPAADHSAVVVSEEIAASGTAPESDFIGRHTALDNLRLATPPRSRRGACLRYAGRFSDGRAPQRWLTTRQRTGSNPCRNAGLASK
jgi:hypothetical protein